MTIVNKKKNEMLFLADWKLKLGYITSVLNIYQHHYIEHWE